MPACSRSACHRAARAFTLIELLVVVAIIALLVGILMPSLSGARDSARRVKSLAHVKVIAEGLEHFRNENERDIRGGGYPSSEGIDDPTADDWKPFPDLYGAHLVVRYLLGRNLDGYISPRDVPRQYWNTADPHWVQKGWYDLPGQGDSPLDDDDDPLPRARYVATESAPVKVARDIPGAEGAHLYDPASPEFSNALFVDAWGSPILYYAADVQAAAAPKVNPAKDHDPFPAVYNFGDNAVFTTGCTKGGCIQVQWDLGGGRRHFVYPVQWRGYTPPNWAECLPTAKSSFAWYVLDKQAYESTGGRRIMPIRKDAFMLISPGRDRVWGTEDDVTNF